MIDHNEETGGPCLHLRSSDRIEMARGAHLASGDTQLTDWPEDFDYWPPNSFLIIKVGNIYKGEEA